VKTVFITGASSGIGASIVEILCNEGMNVFGFARREEKLEKLKQTIIDKGFSGSFTFASGDITSSSDLNLAVEKCIEHYCDLDVVIPNAGLGYFNPLLEGKMEEWEEMIDVNIKGVLRTIHATLPHLVKSKGAIINIGSVAARQVFANSGVYCMTKHAVLAMSESLRIELGNTVSITTINPGAVNTTFIDKTNNVALRKEYKSNFESGMSPEFIAEAVLQTIKAEGKGIYSEITLRPDRRK
jgi:NADP-dependent 3-hydroxy acid dehydrogenase YdfG|tara:strand:+ start:16 stop:738 length:723 start_codon:yes stop_codon:yes gene_type:complete